MYVRSETTIDEITKEIEEIEEELKDPKLSEEDREVLHDELNYLYSFLPKEV